MAKKIKKYKGGEVYEEEGGGYGYGETGAARKASKYIAHEKTHQGRRQGFEGKGPHGGVVEGKKRTKRTIGQKNKPETRKSKSQKEDLRQMKEASRKYGVRKVEKWETGQGAKYKGGKGIKPKAKATKYKGGKVVKKAKKVSYPGMGS